MPGQWGGGKQQWSMGEILTCHTTTASAEGEAPGCYQRQELGLPSPALRVSTALLWRADEEPCGGGGWEMFGWQFVPARNGCAWLPWHCFHKDSGNGCWVPAGTRTCTGLGFGHRNAKFGALKKGLCAWKLVSLTKQKNQKNTVWTILLPPLNHHLQYPYYKWVSQLVSQGVKLLPSKHSARKSLQSGEYCFLTPSRSPVPALAKCWLGRCAGSRTNRSPTPALQNAHALYLLRVFKLPPEAIIHSLCGLFRSANHSLDINFKAAVQQLINFTIVVIIVSVWNWKKHTFIFKKQLFQLHFFVASYEKKQLLLNLYHYSLFKKKTKPPQNNQPCTYLLNKSSASVKKNKANGSKSDIYKMKE